MEDLQNQMEFKLRTIIREEVANAINSVNGSLGEPTSNRRAQSRLLTATEVADMLQLSIQRIYSLARKSETNGFPVLRIGDRTMRFDGNEVLSWTREQ